MKKIIYSFLIVFTAVSLVGCSGDNDPNDGRFNADSDYGYVDFGGNERVTALSGNCGDTSVEIPVFLNAPTNIDGLNVEYTITDIEGTSAGVISHTGDVYFPKGMLQSNIVINYPENAASSLEFVVTLAATSRDNVEIGAVESVGPVATTVRINTGIRDLFLGTYDVLEDGSAEYESVVTAGAAPNELVISNLFGVDSESQTSVFINDDGTVSYPGFADNLLFVSSNPAQGQVFIDGIDGTQSGCDGDIELNFRLRFGPDQDLTTDPINTVLTRR